MIQTNIIGKFNDNLVNTEYELTLINAKDLSEYLRSSYELDGINIDQYNEEKISPPRKISSYEKTENENIEKNPPLEIYEYQNFFLLQKKSGEYILLDGFRRLLWYEAPDHEILVRIYQEEDLTNEKILILMIHLNHFKFYGGGDYIERGFSLLLKSVFNLDIFKYKKAFDAYLSSDKIVNDYGGEYSNNRNKKISTVKNRIINNFFVSDIKFIQDVNEAGFMVNKMFGAFIYNQRINSDKEFNTKLFIEKLNENVVLTPLFEKYKNVGTNNSAKSIEVVNQIMEFYKQFFNFMLGGENFQTYAEKLKECKDLVADLRKDKSLIKLTGNSKYWVVSRELFDRIIVKKEKVRFVCVVFPKEKSTSSWDNEKHTEIKHGLLEKEIIYLKSSTQNMSKSDYYGFKTEEGETFIFGYNYSGYNNVGKQFTYIKNYKMGGDIQKVELFAELPQSILYK
jgi:hypothetical protein